MLKAQQHEFHGRVIAGSEPRQADQLLTSAFLEHPPFGATALHGQGREGLLSRPTKSRLVGIHDTQAHPHNRNWPLKAAVGTAT